MTSKPLSVGDVTVVVPHFRGVVELQRALESVLAQTLPPRRVLVVDDASGADAVGALGNLLQELAPLGAVEAVLLGANAGPGVARNVGWDKATTAYVAFLDADDSWHPEKLETQLEFMELHPQVDIVGGRAGLLSRNGPPPLSPASHGAPTAVTRSQVLAGNPFHTSSALVRTALPRRFGKSSASEDYALWAAAVLEGHTAVVLPVVLSYRYEHPLRASGLNSRLFAMERGELRVMKALHDEKLVTLSELVGAVLWSILKFVRRLVLAPVRRTLCAVGRCV